MIEPSRTSVGHTLLQKLGWRPGQGIGPRVSARKRKLQAQKLGLPLNDDDEVDEEQIGKHTFAPRDVKLLVYETNGDSTGLGFVKGMREALPGIDDGKVVQSDYAK
jgi:G patch domain-containing protein 1